jgi:hypothetical protein
MTKLGVQGCIKHIVGDEDSTSSFPMGAECFVGPDGDDGYRFEGLHVLEHRESGQRLAKHIQVQYGGIVRAFSYDIGVKCKDFFIDITEKNPEWRSIGRVKTMAAKFY